MAQSLIAWQSAARTDTGKVRARNEDAVLESSEAQVWAVADGMGGHQNGALASRLIVERLAESVSGSLDGRVREMRMRLHDVNRCLGQDITLQHGVDTPLIGSTVVALIADDDRAVCIWAGDSRCYLWRQNRLYQLTRDHCLMQELMVEEKLTAQEAARHPKAQALTRAIGASEVLQLDLLELETEPGDTFLLCSDGLYRDVTEADLSQALNQRSPAMAIQQLFDKVLAGRARDNVSAVVVRR